MWQPGHSRVKLVQFYQMGQVFGSFASQEEVVTEYEAELEEAYFFGMAVDDATASVTEEIALLPKEVVGEILKRCTASTKMFFSLTSHGNREHVVSLFGIIPIDQALVSE